MPVSKGKRHGSVPLSTRMLAFLGDYVLIAGYLIVLVGLSYAARPQMTQWFDHGPERAELAGFLLLTVPVYLYFALMEGFGSHATWGKRRLGIWVTDARSRPIALGRSLLRSALKFLPWELAHFTIWRMAIPSGYPDFSIYMLLAIVYGLVFLYLISPLLNRQRRTIYDLVCGTAVRWKPGGDRHGASES